MSLKCSVLGKCGGCNLPLSYEEQLQEKTFLFQEFQPEIYTSPTKGYRARAEFKVYRDESGLHLAMYMGKTPIVIERCKILLPHLQEKLDSLKSFLNQNLEFSSKLFAIEILGTLQKETLLVLIYHRRLCEEWEREAKELEKKMGCKIIGRSRGQKVVVSEDFLQDCLYLAQREYRFIRYDNAFSQPNPYINIKMLEFALSCIDESAKDLLELYCGGGNFTIPLSSRFQKVFATEVAKSSIQALNQNLALNQIQNVFCARLSGEESVEALSFSREFFRLRGINLRDYHFTHLLVDPPRSGIQERKMLEFMRRFENIIYISCNPLSLKEDLKILLQTHRIQRAALFDQFPYTHHLECGMWLRRMG